MFVSHHLQVNIFREIIDYLYLILIYRIFKALEKVLDKTRKMYQKYPLNAKKCMDTENEYGTDNEKCTKFTWFDAQQHDMVLNNFRIPWTAKKPFLVKNASKNDEFLWSPEAFATIAVINKPLVIDCKTRDVCSFDPQKFLLKLGNPYDPSREPKKVADWPANESFRTVFPQQYDNFMENIAFREYTHPDGVFNLVSYSPKFLCNILDLGPKLNIADGTLDSSVTSTHLHKDMSDAINTCKWVVCSKDAKDVSPEDLKNIYMVCDKQIKRFEDNKEKLAALRHLFEAAHYDKINIHLANNNMGSIHDQNAYLTKTDFDSLRNMQVRPYAILQFEGDTIHLPAGLPHQVINFCMSFFILIKFFPNSLFKVKPEHLKECLSTTKEFRLLTNDHTNKEDKLQVNESDYDI
jgi:[histone H3]-dimethyl-L-lysine9 demethylase